VNQPSVHEQRQAWAFWIASVLAFVGGVSPLVFAGFSSRVSSAIIPFWIAAVVFGISARYRSQSRPVAVGLYFIAGLAIVYAMLQLVSLPLRLTLVGTCPPSPAQCLPGLEKAVTEGEQTGLWFGVGIGLVAIFVGYFGLFNLIRRPGAKAATAPRSSVTPPVRTIPPVQDLPEPESKSAEPKPEETKPAESKATDATPPTTDKE
jgi:hypothetical protein